MNTPTNFPDLSLQRRRAPGFTVNSNPSNPAPDNAQGQAAAQAVAEAHPFMPSSALPSAVDLTMPPAERGQNQALTAINSMPAQIGGGWGHPAAANVQAGGGGWGTPTIAPVQPSAVALTMPGHAATSAGSVAGSGGGWGATPLPGALAAAAALDQTKAQAADGDTLADYQRAGALPSAGDDREVRQNKLNYQTLVTGQAVARQQNVLDIANGLPPSAGTVPGYRAPGTSSYVGNKNPGEPGTAVRSDGGVPKPSAMDIVQGMNPAGSAPSELQKYGAWADKGAQQAQAQVMAANAPKWVEDPVTGERKLIYGKDVVNSGTNPEKAKFPKPIEVGGRKLWEVATGKFADEKGNPVEWKDGQEKPLSINEFIMSPALTTKFDNDYSKYRTEHDAQTKKVKAAETPVEKPTTPASPAAPNPHQEAVNWARGNPTDPRATAILKKLGLAQ